MQASSRFHCVSSSLNLKVLRKQTHKALWIGLILALGLHLSLTQVRKFGETQKATKPLTTQFVKRAPRLTKPLEMKKRPQPKRRTMRRKMVALQAKVNRQQVSSRIQATNMIQSLAKPRVVMGRSVSLDQTTAEPAAWAQEILGMKETKDVVDMSLELVDMEELDTGRYQAMVIQDPADLQNMRGYFHLFPVYIRSAAAAEIRSPYGEGTPFAFPGAIRNLVTAMNTYTDIKTDVGKTLGLDSSDVLKVPIIFVSYHVPFHASPAELRTVGQYLMSGGFLYSDTLYYNARIVFDNIRTLWRGALASVEKKYGTDWNFEKIPETHPLYHCYFEFGGPPPGLEASYTRDQWAMVDYLDGVFIDGRLLGICTCKNYWNLWWKGEPLGNTRVLQFGVNIIIFALTQEGSITNSVMDMVGH